MRTRSARFLTHFSGDNATRDTPETHDEATMTATHNFQAEVAQVLSLVINSLYSNKEIFLRELVSNASDALDKLRVNALTDDALLAGDADLHIRVEGDEEAGTLTIWDNGVGMSEEELVKNLGTVAHSGSKAFAAAMEAGKSDVQLIGQFGVGFYSAYLVADRVDVVSRAAGADTAFKWSSDAKETFTVEPAEREVRGTTITLHLREEQKEFASPVATPWSDHQVLGLPQPSDPHAQKCGRRRGADLGADQPRYRPLAASVRRDHG